MPSNLAEAMIRLLDDSSNQGLHLLNQTLRNSEHVLGIVSFQASTPTFAQHSQASRQNSNKSRCHAPRYSRPLNVRCRLILVRASDFAWLQKDSQYLRHLHQVAANGHNWIPAQDLPFNELILFAYAADRTQTYICMSTIRIVSCTHRKGPTTNRPVPRNHTSTRHLLL